MSSTKLAMTVSLMVKQTVTNDSKRKWTFSYAYIPKCFYFNISIIDVAPDVPRR